LFLGKKIKIGSIVFQKKKFHIGQPRSSPKMPENIIKVVQSVLNCIFGLDQGCLHITNSSSICHFLKYNLASKHLIFYVVFLRKKIFFMSGTKLAIFSK